MEHDAIFKMVEKFTTNDLNEFLTCIGFRGFGKVVRYSNGDNISELCKFRLEKSVNKAMYAYIPIRLPPPSWLYFHNYYTCWHNDHVQILPASCEHAFCMARMKNQFPEWCQVNMVKNVRFYVMCLIDEMVNKSPRKEDLAMGFLWTQQKGKFNEILSKHISVSEIQQQQQQVEENDYVMCKNTATSTVSLENLTIELPPKPCVNFVCNIPHMLICELYNGFVFCADVDDKGINCTPIIRYNEKFANRNLLMNQRKCRYALPFYNPLPIREFSIETSNSRVNCVVSKNYVSLTCDEPTIVDLSLLKFKYRDFNFTKSWDMGESKLYVLSFSIANFKNISFPKRNWTEISCFNFLKLVGFVEFSTDALSLHFAESCSMANLYNTSKERGVGNIKTCWAPFFEKDKLEEMCETYKNDRVFQVIGLVNGEEHMMRIRKAFDTFCACIVHPSANLHEAKSIGHLEYCNSIPIALANSMKDSFSQKIFNSNAFMDNLQEAIHSKFLVPIFLKPNGLTYVGFNAFVEQVTVGRVFFENISLTCANFFYYSDEIIRAFYPNANGRPYGEEWHNYLSSGKSALLLFDCSKLLESYNGDADACVRIWRDICVASRIASGFIWTRNICHCPDSEAERRINIEFIFSKENPFNF